MLEGNLAKIEEQAREDIKSMQGSRSVLIEKAKKLKRMWLGQRTAPKYRGRANVSVPLPYWYSETMIPRLMGSVFGGRDIYEVLPLPGGNFESAKANKNVMNYQLMFEMDAFMNLLGFCQQMERTAMGQMKLRWNPVDGHPEIHLIRTGDLIWDGRAGPLINRAVWKAQRVEKTKRELEALITLPGAFPQEIEELLRSGKGTTVLNPGETEGQSINLPKGREVYEEYEWHGKVPAKLAMEIPDMKPTGKEYEDVIVCMANDNALRMYQSPYGSDTPFIVCCDVSDPFEIGAYSENEFTEGLYNVASDIMCQRLDNVTMNINRMWTVIKGSGIRRENLISFPHGYIEVSSHEDIKERPIENVTQQAYQEMNEAVNMAKDTSGLLDLVRGVDTGKTDTASGIQMLMTNANMRPGLKVQTFQYVVMSRLGDLMLSQNSKFLDKKKMGFILGERDPQKMLMEVQPKDLQGNFRVYPLSYSLAGNKDVRIGQLVNALNTMRGMETVQPDGSTQGPDLVPAVLEELASLLDIRKAEPVVEAWRQGKLKMVEQKKVMDAKGMLQQALQGGAMRGAVGAPGMANVAGQLPALDGVVGTGAQN